MFRLRNPLPSHAKARRLYAIGLAMPLSFGLLAVNNANAAEVDHESERDSSTPIVTKTDFELDSSSDSTLTVPASLEQEGDAEPITSVWACVPDGLDLSIRVGEDSASLQEAEFMSLDTDQGVENAPDCSEGVLTEGTWVGYAELVQLQVEDGSVELLDDTTVFGRSALDRDDPDTINERMVENTVSIIDGDLEIVTREGWGADESLRNRPNDDPNSDQADHISLHHTAGINDYTRSESAEVVEGIYTAHTLGNGWNDIGFNILIDQFGTAYEGRVGTLGTDGGQGFFLDNPFATGIHTGGFNTAGFGVAFIGTHSQPDEELGEMGAPVSDAARETMLDVITAVAGSHEIDLNTVVTRDCVFANDFCENDQLVTPRLTYRRAFSPSVSPGGFVIDQLFAGQEFSEIDFAGGEGIADTETGLLEPAIEGTLRFEYNEQTEEERTAWMVQILDHELDQETDEPSDTDHDTIREAHLTLAEVQRQEAEIKRQMALAERMLTQQG